MDATKNIIIQEDLENTGDDIKVFYDSLPEKEKVEVLEKLKEITGLQRDYLKKIEGGIKDTVSEVRLIRDLKK